MGEAVREVVDVSARCEVGRNSVLLRFTPPGTAPPSSRSLTGTFSVPFDHTGPGEWGVILVIRCTCGHNLERHMDTEACEVEGCPCAGFEFGWDEETKETIRV